LKPGYEVIVQSGEYLQRGAAYAQKGKSKLKIKDEGTVMEVNGEYIVI